MARFRDVPHVLRTIGWWGFVKRVYQQLNEDQVYTWAAALAYSWIFAIFPFFIFMLTLAPYLPGNTRDTAQREINEYIDHSLPARAAATLKDNVERVMNEPRGGLLSIGLLVTIWAASGGMAMTMRAIDMAYDVRTARSYLKQRTLAVGLTVAVAIMILLVMLLLPVGTLVLRWIASQGEIFRPVLWLVNIVRYTLAFVLLFGVLALIYHFGPSIRRRFHAITPGAVFAVAVWLILAVAFRYYINRYGRYDQMYGTVGGVAILLLFFYIDALVLLVGAEINSEIDFVVVGIPSTSAESLEQAAAHAAVTNAENRELARELNEKRSGAADPRA